MTGLTGAALGLAEIVFTGETDFFLLSDLLGCDLTGDSDLIAADLLGRTSLASTLTSALGAFFAGLVSFFPVDGFRAELAGCTLFTGETSALIGVGLTGVLAGTGLTSDLEGVGFTSDLAGVGLGSAFTAVAFAGVGFTGVCLTGEVSFLAGVCFVSDLTADLGFDSDLTADLGLASDFTADLGFDSDFTAELGFASALTADFGFADEGYSDFLAEGFLGDGVDEILGVGERPRSSALISGSCFMTTSSSVFCTKPHALIFFGEDLTDFMTTSSFTADSSSIEGRMSFLADCFALNLIADAAPLSFLAAEALPEF